MFTPLGGSPNFYIEGLCGGLGLHYRLTLPELSKISEYPLIECLSTRNNVDSEKLGGILKPEKDSDFFILGASVSTFGLIKTNLIVDISVKPQFGLSLIGSTVFDFPQKGRDAIVHATLDYTAGYVSSSSCVEVIGALKEDSYLFLPECKLSGGFAFGMWFDGPHKNDFVFTVGGYHPSFSLLDHPYYPTVDRVGINWKISSQVAISGSAYMALTSSGIMAGGSLSFVYQMGRLKAWLNAMCDFWMQWKPWHYEASIGVSIGASYTLKIGSLHHTFEVELGAALDIAGPSFHGKAHVHWNIISFTISFGDDKNQNETVDWKSVEQFLVSGEEKICAIALKGCTQGENIVRSDAVSLEIKSQIPVTDLSCNFEKRLSDRELYCLPFGKNTPLSSKMKVTLERHDDNGTVLVSTEVSEISENVPAALWGESHNGSPTAEFIPNANKGVRLSGAVKMSENMLPEGGVYDEDKLENEKISLSHLISNDNAVLRYEFDEVCSNHEIEKNIETAYSGFINANKKITEEFELYNPKFNNFTMNRYHCDIRTGMIE
jgi:hypothetical protein